MTNKSLIPASLLLMAVLCSAQTTQPSTIFEQSLAQYQSMPTFAATGKITCYIETAQAKINLQTTFSLKLKKPNQYLITWDQTSAGLPFHHSGAVWNQGAQPYFYMSAGFSKKYEKINDDHIALASATGISGGAAYTIPSIFLQVGQPRLFGRLINPQLEGSETIAGDDCFKIVGSSKISKEETFWISKSTHLIRQYSRSLESPNNRSPIPQMTDQQIDQVIKASGQQPTEGRREEMRATMQKARAAMANIKGTSTETYLQISSPDLKPADFAFTPPAGTVLKDSMFNSPTTSK